MKRLGCERGKIRSDDGKCYPLRKVWFNVMIPITDRQPEWYLSDLEKVLSEHGVIFDKEIGKIEENKPYHIWFLDWSLKGAYKSNLIRCLENNLIVFEIFDVKTKKGVSLEK